MAGNVLKPFRVLRGVESPIRRTGKGRETLPQGQEDLGGHPGGWEGSGGPTGGLGGVGRPLQRAVRVWEGWKR